MSEDTWTNWAKQIKAISQIGRAYSENPYDLERYAQLDEIAHAMFAQLADAPVERVANLFIGDSGYATPKVDLRGGVFRDGKILLVKERTDDKWALPGGWADVNESPRLGIEREIWEESGYKARALRLVAVKDHAVHDYFPKHPYHIYKLFFLCELAYRRWHPQRPGTVLLVYGYYQGVHRYVMETFRVDPRGGTFHFGLTISQEIAVGIFLGTALLHLYLATRVWPATLAKAEA